jgi:hypothetical protein
MGYAYGVDMPTGHAYAVGMTEREGRNEMTEKRDDRGRTMTEDQWTAAADGED